MRQTELFNGHIIRVKLISKPSVTMLCLDGGLVPYHMVREVGSTYDIAEAVATAAEDAVHEGARYAFAMGTSRNGISYEEYGDVIHEWSNKDRGSVPPWLVQPGMPRSLLVIRTDEVPQLESWGTYVGVKLSLEWLIKKGSPHHWHVTAYRWLDDNYIEIGQSTLGEVADSLMAKVLGIVDRTVGETVNAQA